jgi:hypothetical protein
MKEIPDKEILTQMQLMSWRYAPVDPEAQEHIEERLIETARRKDLIHYSDLVEGVLFMVESSEGNRDHVITDWSEFDRALIGDHLGYLNMRYYERHGVLLGSLAISKEQSNPGPGYFNFLRDAGLLRVRDEDRQIEFWIREVERVYQHFL